MDTEVGDVFWHGVQGEDHYFEVREIEIDLPGETDLQGIIGGDDWLRYLPALPFEPIVPEFLSNHEALTERLLRIGRSVVALL